MRPSPSHNNGGGRARVGVRTAGDRRGRRARTTAPWLFALALLLKALLPAGYMVDPARAAGVWPISLCPDGLPPAAAASTTRPVDRTGAHLAHHNGPFGHGGQAAPAGETPDAGHAAQPAGECAFSGLGAPVIGPVATIAAEAPRPVPPPYLAAIPDVGRGLAAPPPPSTGPPAIL